MQFYKEVLTSSKETLRSLRIMLYDPRVDLGEMLECVELDCLEEVSLKIQDGVAWYRDKFNHGYREKLMQAEMRSLKRFTYHSTKNSQGLFSAMKSKIGSNTEHDGGPLFEIGCNQLIDD
jgi:hypothetical protein